MPPERGLGWEADRVRRVRVKSVCVWLRVGVCAQEAGVPHTVMASRIRIKTDFQFTFSRARQQLHMEGGDFRSSHKHIHIAYFLLNLANIKQSKMLVESCSVVKWQPTVFRKPCESWTFADPRGRIHCEAWLLPHGDSSVGVHRGTVVWIWYLAQVLLNDTWNWNILGDCISLCLNMKLIHINCTHMSYSDEKIIFIIYFLLSAM